VTWCNGNSFNGNSAYAVAAEDRTVRSLPWLLRVAVPGYPGGWPV